MFGGFTKDCGAPRRRVDQLNFDTMIPGHGEVMRTEKARAYVHLLIDFIEAVTEQVSTETHRLGTGAANLPAVREGVQKNIDVASWRRKFAGDSKDEQDAFDTTFAAMITAAHAEKKGRKSWHEEGVHSPRARDPC